MTLKEKVKTSTQIRNSEKTTDDEWVLLSDVEAYIQQLKERNKKNRRTIQLEQERAQKLKEQVEAAKTILNEHKVMYLSLDQQLRLRKVLEDKL